MTNSLYIRGGRIVDPAAGRDEIGDLYIHKGVIAPTPAKPPADAEIFEAKGLVVVPGFIDLHVHFREPGGEEAETIETASRAAARGGFVAAVAMPNTRPPLDTPERVAACKACGERVGLIHVMPSASFSVGREGRELTRFAELVKAGAVALTDDGSTAQDESVMFEVMKQAARMGLLVMDHAEDAAVAKGGVMHAGAYSEKYGLPGIPSAAEVNIVRRDIGIAEKTGCAIHIQHVSAAESVKLIAAARKRGLQASGELTPHHLALTDADVDPANADFKMNPPLRSREDRAALIAGIVTGALQAFATDHAPHTKARKAEGFLKAPFGIVGLETAIGVTFTETVHRGLMDLPTWVRRWTVGPAAILSLPPPSLKQGAVANVTILDLQSEWVVRPEAFISKSQNTPFAGRRLVGRAVRTVYRGVTTLNQVG